MASCVSFLLRCSVPVAHYLTVFQRLRRNQKDIFVNAYVWHNATLQGRPPSYAGGYLQRLGGLCAICSDPADFPCWIIQICRIIKLRTAELGKRRLTLRLCLCLLLSGSSMTFFACGPRRGLPSKCHTRWDARLQPQRGDLTKPRPPAWVEKFTPLGFASPERA